jgi:putative heme-binding domain-containing protein
VDGKEWGEPVARGRGDLPITQIELNAPQPVAHIRITQTGRSPNKYWSIHELTIKGLSPQAAAQAALSLSQRLAAESPVVLAQQARQQGNAARGAALFFNPTQSCAKCHEPGSGNRLGPDLSSKREGVSDVFLVDSVLRPSQHIRKGFEPLVVVTLDGLIVTGFPIADDADKLVLREPAAGKELSIDKEDIEETRKGVTSLMPAGLANQLGDRKQFLDLVRFLMEIHAEGPSRLVELKQAVNTELPPSSPMPKR